ncbi:MAG: RHS repeat-associated core domain-containing protein, partial [Terriglobales bacterium]
HQEQRTTNSSPNNITKTTTYYLDLAGNVTQIVYPYPTGGTPGRTVNYTHDSANRPSSATDASNGITYVADWKTPPANTNCTAGAVCYTPQGSVYGMSIGQSSSFTGLNVLETFNSRLQPNEIKGSSTAGNAIDITYNFVDPVTTHNAGHVYGITNNLNSSRSQAFTFDQVNRILSAGTTATTGTYCWGYQYSYDAWGNLLSQAGWSPTYNSCTETTMGAVTANGNNQITGFSYDASGNTLGDGTYTYTWDGESQMKTAAGVTYAYDGDGRRAAKVGSKLYWYGSGGEILAETDAAGNTLNEYIFFGGKRVAVVPASGSAMYYAEDLLGSSRVIVQSNGTLCYDADFTPFGGEKSYTSTCPQNYKFEGKERDTETQNDDFGARYYTWRFGRWLSSDWSAVPVPVPYANLNNPQTLNLYSMVSDDPESFADLDGHANSNSTTTSATCGNTSFDGAWDCVGDAGGGRLAAGRAEGMGDDAPTVDGDPARFGAFYTGDAPKFGEAQNQNPINMSVSVSQEPQIMENLKLGDKTMTGVGAQLNISLTDKNGSPLSGSVTESNKEGGMQNPGSVTLTNGAFKDYVGKFGDASKMPGTVADLKDYVTTNPITVTSTQTLNIRAGKASYQATWTRTLSNVGANGKLNTTFNSHGMNFTIKWTDPVIKAISP